MPNSRITLALVFGDSPPVEFRLFVAGWNETENGRYLFDEQAAKQVMAAYTQWGIDLPIDLEHQMLDVEPGAADPNARDARGWCKLELRGGELWAVGVTWSPDGAARLAEKRQRYVSPAFKTDPKTHRIVKIINCAITALPATHNTPALVAASATGKKSMDPELIKKALEAIANGDDAAATEILKGMIVNAAGGDADGGEGDGAEGVPSVTEDALADPDDDEEKPVKKAMRLALCRLTGKSTFAEAVGQVEIYRASHLTLETERATLAKDRATLESAERRKLVADLIKLGAEYPSTIWADDKATTIKARWLKMPIAELRSHVSEQTAARAANKPAAVGVRPAANAGATPEVAALSASELAICAATKCDPQDFAALKAFRDNGKA